MEKLKNEMKLIFDNYKKLNIYPYEIYTLMLGLANKEKFIYNLEIHNKLLITYDKD